MTLVSLTSVSLSEWRDLCFIAAGVFIFARAIPDAVYWVILASASEPVAPDLTLEQKVSAVATLLELIIGLGLILGARGLGNLIQRLRRAGTPVDSSDVERNAL